MSNGNAMPIKAMDPGLLRIDQFEASQSKHGTFPLSITEISKSMAWKVKLWHYVLMISLFCLFLWSMVWLVRFDSNKCTINQEQLNTCVRKILFFSSEVDHFPSDDKQLDLYCKEKAESIQCLRQYVNTCLDVDKKQKKYFRRFVSSYKTQLDKTCLKHAEREKFINYSGCLSENELMHNATECMDVHQNQLLYIAENVPENRRMAAACCSLHLRHSCLNTNIAQRCQREVKSFVMDQVEGPYRGLVQTVCSPHYLSLSGCQRSIELPLWKKIFEQSNTLVRKYSHNETIESEFAEATNGTNHSDHIRIKIVKLKSQESFLAFIFIMKNNSK